jgi:hypothetical protein
MKVIFTQEDEILTPRQVLEMKEMTCTLLVRVFEFIIAAVEQGNGPNTNLVQTICGKNFWYLPTVLKFQLKKVISCPKLKTKYFIPRFKIFTISL